MAFGPGSGPLSPRPDPFFFLPAGNVIYIFKVIPKWGPAPPPKFFFCHREVKTYWPELPNPFWPVLLCLIDGPTPFDGPRGPKGIIARQFFLFPALDSVKTPLPPARWVHPVQGRALRIGFRSAGQSFCL